MFLVYKINAYAKIKHWERNYLISNWRGGKETKYRGICSCPIRRHFVSTEEEVPIPMIRLNLERGGKRIICVEWVKKPKSSYSTLWVNGAYVSNFDPTSSFGSDQRLILGNIIDGGDVSFLGTTAVMEIYIDITEGVPGLVKKEIMKALYRDYGVDIDQGD